MENQDVLTLIIAQNYLSGDRISLSRYKLIEDAAAVTLCKTTEDYGHLELRGLIRLSNKAAKALSKYYGQLYLNSLTFLPVSVAKALSMHSGPMLILDGLTELSEKSAIELAKYKGYLSLDGLKKLEDDVLDALCQHRGDLSLYRLEIISNKGAKSLSKVKGNLSLYSIKSLTDEAAKELSFHEGTIDLGSLESISDIGLESFLHHKGEIKLEDKVRERFNQMKIKSQINTKSMSIIKSFLEKLDTDKTFFKEYLEWLEKDTSRWTYYSLNYTIQFAASKRFYFSEIDAQNFYYENINDFKSVPRWNPNFNYPVPEGSTKKYKNGVFWNF